MALRSSIQARGAAITGKNTSSTTDAYGLQGEANSYALSSGVHGRNVGAGPLGFGVFGTHEGDGIAVYGVSAGTGVMGQAAGANCIGVHWIYLWHRQHRRIGRRQYGRTRRKRRRGRERCAWICSQWVFRLF